MNTKIPVKFIDSPEALAELVGVLEQQTEIAIDTESNGLFAYQEQVCLIQFSTREQDYVVDPLALSNLNILAPLFENKKILKVFHAAEYDVICLKRDFGFEIINLFDTMLASRVLGIKTLGLGKILEERFKVHAQKKYQRADWGKRPLTPDMINYATTDTHYLLELKDQLAAELEKIDRQKLAEEEFNRISKVNGAERTTLEEILRKLVSANKLNPHEAAVLFELLKERDVRARKRNVPVFKVISDRALVAIVDYMPSDRKSLERVDGVSPRLISRHANWLLKAISVGRKKEGIKIKRKKKWDSAYAGRLDNLKKWRRQEAQKMQVESDVILPREIMETLAWRNPQSMEVIGEVMACLPWRLENYQTAIYQLFQTINSGE